MRADQIIPSLTRYGVSSRVRNVTFTFLFTYCFVFWLRPWSFFLSQCMFDVSSSFLLPVYFYAVVNECLSVTRAGLIMFSVDHV